MGVGALCLFIGHTIGTTICAYMYFAIRRMKNRFSKETYRLQKILHLSVVLEFGICTVLLAMPLNITATLVAFPTPYGSHVAYVCCVVASSQTMFSTVAQCYFIRPFRKCAKETFWVVFKPFWRNSERNVVWTTQQSIGSKTVAKSSALWVAPTSGQRFKTIVKRFVNIASN